MYINVPKKIIKHLVLLMLTYPSAINLFSQPVADFSATPVNGCAPLLVNFTDLSTGNPTAWKWDLGNGTISLLQNPSVTYFSSGKYRITLTATNNAGSNTIVRDEYINVYKAPFVGFTSNSTTGCLPLPVQFTDNSLPGDGTVISWQWDFGDGVVNSAQHPQHTYTSPGIFDVSLQIKNSFGCIGLVSKTKYINTATVIANFSNNVQSTCKPPVNLNFKNLSSGLSLTYNWNFGDGTTSAIANPSHPYTIAKKYTVQLIATGATGCTNTLKKEIVIGTVSADFSSPTTVCPGEEFSLKNTSVPTPGKVQWYFSDGTISDSLNPFKTFKNPGTYIIKMVADFGACYDSVSKTINVLSKQNIDFNAVDTTACKPPLTVNFISNVPGATRLIWDFGDGTSASSANPSHTYSTFGAFDVTLISINSAGCSDTLKKPVFIKIQSPIITLPGLPLGGCAPFTHTFSYNLISFDSVASYSWNFGDGTSANTPTPTHTFSKTGSYNISLSIVTLSGCTATTTVLNGIKAGSKTSANFKANPLVSCLGSYTGFTDLSTGNPDEWLWSFGDGRTSVAKNPGYRYSDTGHFDVTLTVRNNGCPSQITFPKYIYITPPLAKFTVIKDCENRFLKVFINSSKGADTWEWNFGDGTTSSVLNPIHTYADTGVYTVSLKVTNSSTGCQHTTFQKLYVIIQKAQFTVSETNICKGTAVLFQQQDLVTSRIARYNWNFNDGSFVDSTSDKVIHLFNKRGAYDIRLIIINLAGCNDTLLKTSYIKVLGPTASFTNSTLGGCVNKSITFTDNSLSDGIYPITKWIWNYGDNISETLNAPPFSHVYNQPGSYIVTLKVLDNNGCTDSIPAANSIIISEPLANFTTVDTASCPFKPVSFNTLSTGADLSYLWDFGDGTNSTDTDPVHQYSITGSFTINMIVTDKYGCSNNMSKKDFVVISYPKADFTLSDSISSCPPFSVTFESQSSNYDTLKWDFGDGNTSELNNPTHFYYIPGTYIIRLKAIGPGGCYDEKLSTIIVNGPTGVMSYNNITGCIPVTVNFNANAVNNLLFIWDFNDGTIVKTSNAALSHTYTNSGFYLPKLILEDINGCQVPIIGADTIKVLEATAAFNIIKKTICDEGVFNFIDSSFGNDSIKYYLWSFGDGTTSNNQSPAHNYTAPGQYTVQLEVTTVMGCKSTSAKVSYAKIIASPGVSISGSNNGCVFDLLDFKGIFLKPDTSVVTWKWNFGNGQSSLLQNAQPQVYSTGGNYTITAIATNSSGCSDTALFPVTVNALPKIKAGNDIYLCQGKSAQLLATGGISYQWIDPLEFLSCSNCSNPVTNTTENKMYVVRGINEFGCSAVDSVLVKIKKPFKISISPNADSICIGQKAGLNASYAENYLWSPASGISNTRIRNPIVSPKITTTYKVVGYDSSNCFKDSSVVKVTVFKYPLVNAGPDKAIFSGSSLKISSTYSNDVVRWMWTPVNGLNCTDCPSPVAMPSLTTHFNLEVKNDGNCTASDSITVFVICKNANVFVPNTFSPNGDGVNDIFYPRGNGIFMVRMFRISNRWGEVMFEKGNIPPNTFSMGWNGTFKGHKLEPDIFIYILDVVCENNLILTFTGNVALVK